MLREVARSHAFYDINPGEVFWAASDVGWVVGHSYICYAPLLHGATTIVFEGKPVGTPDAGTFWRVISEHKVAALFTAPTAFRAIKANDPKGEFISNYDLSEFRTLFLAGERADPETIRWAQESLDRPVIDHWWQTETGWTMAGNPVGLGALPVKLGSPCVPMPGYDIQVLDDEGNPMPAGEMGNVVVKLPLPPSALPTLWNAEARFKSSYLEEFPGFYQTGDAGYLDEDGYLFIMGSVENWSSWCVRKSDRWPPLKPWCPSQGFPRPVLARSCAERSRRSPTARISKCPQRLMIRQFWTKSDRLWWIRVCWTEPWVLPQRTGLRTLTI